MAAAGKVYLVGGGPGDPGLLTLRGKACLEQADVILYDYLVNSQILALARAGCEAICLGRHGRGRLWSQAEINQQMVRLAREGRTVVRLKGGDPAVFAHAAEEIAALTQAGIDFEIVPGITAALAVGSYTGIPLTQADAASALAFVTGREREDKPAENLDYRALAAFPGTLVFYMGVTSAAQWSAQLIAAGKPAGTPAAIVWRCTWPDQQTIRCTLATLAAQIESRRLRPPALVIVGAVAALGADDSWFTARPLFGRRIVVTRAARQATELASALGALGADVRLQPAIEIAPPIDQRPLDAAISLLGDYDWLVFSSANGVPAFLDRLLATGRDLRELGRLKIAAVGPGTAEELSRYHLRADVVPAEFRAEALAVSLRAEAQRGGRFLLVRASRGRDLLANELRAAGATVDQVVAYESRDVAQPDAEILAALQAGQIDWITVTSSAIAGSLANLFGEDLRRAKLASISPLTSARVRELGHEVAAESSAYTLEGLVEAIRTAESSR